MKSLKVGALFLLTIASGALADVGIIATLLKAESIEGLGGTQLQLNKPKVVFVDNQMRLEAVLVDENEDKACVNVTLFTKNDQNEFCVFSSKELITLKEEKAVGTIESLMAIASTDGEIAQVVVCVTKQ